MNRSSSLTLLLTSSLLTGSTALGQQVLLDQQPSHAFSLLCTLGTESNADDFVVGSAGAVLDTVTWWGTWGPSGIAAADTFDVYVHENAIGGPPFFDNEPGTVIASFLGQAPTVTATAGTVPTAAGPLTEYRLELTLPSSVALIPGSYWVEIYSTASSGSNDVFSWEMAPLDAVRGVACMSWSTSTPGVSWNSCTPFPETDLALMLTGDSNLGNSYCGPAIANSTSAPGVISATGSSSATANDVTLEATELPPNQFGYFLNSMTQASTFPVPGSQGVLCLGGSIGRYNANIFNSGAGGTGSLVLDLPNTPTPTGTTSISAGETWNFTCWFRDNNPGPTSNFTDAVSITFN